MLFNSLQFLIFFPVVTLVYFIIPKKINYLWLLIMSYYFYMCWNAKYALLMLFSTFVTYTCGLLLEGIKHTSWEEKQKNSYKNLLVFLSFALNLLILGYYKYSNFAIDLIAKIFGLINVNLNIPVFDIILPVGISFYTFQALSYTMDVYRDEIYAERNFFRYALFVSFFPQLVAGPIERSKNLLRQLAEPQNFCFERARYGFLLMLWGFFLKVVLADRIAIFVDTVYGDYMRFGGWYLIIATVLFAFQIYCDFYGYSVIAIGSAQILGIEIMENFRAPYLSCSVAGFWRNWHISLTSWFKDYLYIPLGGGRKGTLRKYINKILVFLVSGLWHGADLSFVAWGLLNGIYQVIGEILNPMRKKIINALHVNQQHFVYRIAQILITFVLVDFSWIFFRSDSITVALRIIKQMVSVNNIYILNILNDHSLGSCGLNGENLAVMVLCILILLIADVCKCKKISIGHRIAELPWWMQSVLVAVIICIILVFGIWGPEYNQANFIYFQF